MKAPPAAATDARRRPGEGAARAAGNKSDMTDITDTGATNR
jgi:hypothetical protein